MADLLVRNDFDLTTGDWAWQEGMIVDIFPDGQLGPGLQQHPRFWIVRLPPHSKDDLAYLLEMQLGPEVDDPDLGTHRPPMGRRKDKFDQLKLTGNVRKDLNADREITIEATLAEIQNFITHQWPDES
jgi:hypothetical protein